MVALDPARHSTLVRMQIHRTLFAVTALLLSSPAIAGAEQDRAAILKVIAQMEAAWNHGDFRGYMAGFQKPDVVFVSGGKFLDGWQRTLDHYVRD